MYDSRYDNNNVSLPGNSSTHDPSPSSQCPGMDDDDSRIPYPFPLRLLAMDVDGDLRWTTMARPRLWRCFPPPLLHGGPPARVVGRRGCFVHCSRTPRRDGDLSASNVPRLRGFWPGGLRVPGPEWSPSAFFAEWIGPNDRDRYPT